MNHKSYNEWKSNCEWNKLLGQTISCSKKNCSIIFLELLSYESFLVCQNSLNNIIIKVESQT